MNLYAYVRNDPLSGRDPTGTSCTITTNDEGRREASCKIDEVRDRRGVRTATQRDRNRYRRFERAYTNAVNRLLSRNEESVDVTIPAPPDGSPESATPDSARSFTVTAGQVAESLAARTARVNPDTEGGMGARPSGVLNVYRNALLYGEPGLRAPNLGSYDRNIAMSLTHEGLHKPGVDGDLPITLADEPWQYLHQDPYNNAARNLLDY